MKKCATPNCGWKELDEFYHDRTRHDRKCQYCKVCVKAKEKKKYLTHTSACLSRSRQYARKVKVEAMNQYGKVCQCCGEPRLEFLVLDHINGDGAEHRRKMEYGHSCTGYMFYLWLRKRGWPKDLGLQVLCANCNTAKGSNGVCPHVAERAAGLTDGAGI